MKGSAQVVVEYGSQRETLDLLVVKGNGPSLMGRDWLLKIRLNWHELMALTTCESPALEAMLAKHAKLFTKELGTIQGINASLLIHEHAKPYFSSPRPFPYAIREKVEKELSRLEKQGIIEQVRFSNWAAPLVPVLKKYGSIRVCGDYKRTINKAAIVDSYPIPRMEDLFASLAGGIVFSKLDLAHACQQLELDDASKGLAVVNTHKGLFRYNRLPFGVSAAAAVFQRTMESLLRDIPSVCVYLDDILVAEKSEEDHIKNLDTVLTRLEDAGARLKREKCEFLLPEITYLRHKISAKGLQPTDDKVKAVTSFPTPRDVSQLKAFLGKVNYYAKFLPNLS